MDIPSFSNLDPSSPFNGRYRIIRAIRSGAMGAVYEVLDEKTDTPRALKVMLPSLLDDCDLKERFEREAKVTGPIASDHIVRVTDAGIDEALGIPFLVMELLQGQELGQLLKERGRLSPHEIVTYLYQVALALDKTHAAGIVHRDLKPDNLFLTQRDDGSPCIKILDFGIAKLVAQGTAAGTRAMGTPLYMAPEQIRGNALIGPRTDIYALGHVAYTLFCGKAYWKEESSRSDSIYPVLAEIIHGPRELPSVRAVRISSIRIPPAFDAWFVKTTAGDMGERYERATDAIRALGEALDVPLSGLPQKAQSSSSPVETVAKTVPQIESFGTVLLDSTPKMTEPQQDAFHDTVVERPRSTPPTAMDGSGALLNAAATKPSVASPSRLQTPLWTVSVVVVVVGAASFVVSKRQTPAEPAPSEPANAKTPAGSMIPPAAIAPMSASSYEEMVKPFVDAGPDKPVDSMPDVATSGTRVEVPKPMVANPTAVIPAKRNPMPVKAPEPTTLAPKTSTASAPHAPVPTTSPREELF